jgi:hypothetical protein
MRERLRPFSFSRVVLVTVALVSGGVLGVADAAGQGFDQTTTAKRYNFSVTGEGGDGNRMAAVGWFEASAAAPPGNIVVGHAEVTEVVGINSFFCSLPLSLVVDSSISVNDAENGTYSVRIRFDDGGTCSFALTTSLLLDNRQGRSGKMAGSYGAFSGQQGGGGALSGAISEK